MLGADDAGIWSEGLPDLIRLVPLIERQVGCCAMPEPQADVFEWAVDVARWLTLHASGVTFRVEKARGMGGPRIVAVPRDR